MPESESFTLTFSTFPTSFFSGASAPSAVGESPSVARLFMIGTVEPRLFEGSKDLTNGTIFGSFLNFTASLATE